MNMNLLQLPLLQEAAPNAASSIPMLVAFGLLFVIFYFLIIRPQQKRDKEHKKMLEELAKGDKVVTAGGIHGVVHSLSNENTVVLKVDDDTTMEFSRGSVSAVVQKKNAPKKTTESDTKESSKESK